MVEVLVWVRQSGKLSGTPVEVDIAGAESGEEAHLWLPGLHWEEVTQEVSLTGQNAATSHIGGQEWDVEQVGC